jgi:dephospho-CoA kinase
VHVFGLTGGLASGKGVVAARFSRRGLPVVNADMLAREVVMPGSEGLAAVVAAFGPAMLTEGGELDRKALGRCVFADPEARRRLESITHPRIQAAKRARMRALEERGEPLACYEVPLLVEVGLTEELRPVVVVAAKEAQQLERALRRDGMSEADARARLSAQLPLARKIAVADYVIQNDGSLAQAEAEADRVLEAICAERGVDAARYPRP